jgi:hypothetical protein
MMHSLVIAELTLCCSIVFRISISLIFFRRIASSSSASALAFLLPFFSLSNFCSNRAHATEFIQPILSCINRPGRVVRRLTSAGDSVQALISVFASSVLAENPLDRNLVGSISVRISNGLSERHVIVSFRQVSEIRLGTHSKADQRLPGG